MLGLCSWVWNLCRLYDYSDSKNMAKVMLCLVLPLRALRLEDLSCHVRSWTILLDRPHERPWELTVREYGTCRATVSAKAPETWVKPSWILQTSSAANGTLHSNNIWCYLEQKNHPAKLAWISGLKVMNTVQWLLFCFKLPSLVWFVMQRITRTNSSSPHGHRLSGLLSCPKQLQKVWNNNYKQSEWLNHLQIQGEKMIVVGNRMSDSQCLYVPWPN